MNELTRRVLFAVPAAAFFLWVTWMGGWLFNGTVILLALVMVWEHARLLRMAGQHVDAVFPYTIGLWILLSPYLLYVLEIGIGILLLLLAVELFRSTKRAVPELASTLFCGFYVPVGMMSFILIRQTPTGDAGFWLAVSLLLMVWGNDIFAYFGGKNFGKRLMAPSISPKKTWEGFFSGVIGAAAGLAIVFLAVPGAFSLSYAWMVPAAILISIFGPIGDLTESRFKRLAGVKDSSNLLPGHGGLFDRFDAMILAAPAMLLYLTVLTIFGYAAF